MFSVTFLMFAFELSEIQSHFFFNALFGHGCLKWIHSNKLIEIIFQIEITSFSNTHLILPGIVHLRTIASQLEVLFCL